MIDADGYLCRGISGGINMIEDFEVGSWPWSPWVVIASGGTVGSAYAHEGSRGIINPGWHYRTDVNIGNAGDKLSAWARPTNATNGRFYLGFGASSSGCYSFVLSPGTNNVLIQQNSEYGYSDVASSSQSYVANKWYRMEVEFVSSSSVTCRLYDSDGTTVLRTLNYSGVSGTPRGIAMRGFGDIHIDEIEGTTGSRRRPTPSIAHSEPRRSAELDTVPSIPE